MTMRKYWLPALILVIAGTIATTQDGLILPSGSNTLKSLHFDGFPALGLYMSSPGVMFFGNNAYGLSCVDAKTCTLTGTEITAPTITTPTLTTPTISGIATITTVAFPLVADATIQEGQTVMPDAGTDGRFDVTTGSATLSIGVYNGTGPTAQGTSYSLVSNGLAYVALAEDQAATRGHHLLQSGTAGYCNDSATVSSDGLNIGKALYSEAVSATINPIGCTGGNGCINTALDTPSSGPAGQITLGVDVLVLGWAEGDPVIYWNSGGTTPTGLTDGKVYFIKTVVDTTKVLIAATVGGAAIVPTTQGNDGTQYLQRLPLSVVSIQ